METQRIAAPLDLSKITRRVIPKDKVDIEYEERVRELLAQKQTREHIYENKHKDLAHLGSLIGTSYENSKILNKLVRQAISLKNHLETHMDPKNQESKLLLVTLKKVIRLVTRYQKDTSDLPYDWVRQRFFPSKFRGWKYSYPEMEPWILLRGVKPEMKYVPLDDDDCETVNGSKTVEGPLKDPLCSRLCISNLAFPDHFLPHKRALRSLSPEKAWLYMNFFLVENAKNFPDAEEDKIWLEFKEFDKVTRESVGTNSKFDVVEIKSIGVDHPIVSAVGNFAVAAFNKACKKHVKKDEDNNLHGFEFMECMYLKVDGFYHFYMIIEAIEEGNPGTYMAEVSCNSKNGAKLLCKFVLTDYRPSGMKAMGVSYISCLELICKAVDDLCKEKRDKLKELFKNLNVFERPIAAEELGRLRKLYEKLREVLLARCASARLRCPPYFDRMTNPDGWCDPVDHHGSGMVRRAKGTSCYGYDYYNPHI